MPFLPVMIRIFIHIRPIYVAFSTCNDIHICKAHIHMYLQVPVICIGWALLLVADTSLLFPPQVSSKLVKIISANHFSYVQVMDSFALLMFIRCFTVCMKFTDAELNYLFLLILLSCVGDGECAGYRRGTARSSFNLHPSSQVSATCQLSPRFLFGRGRGGICLPLKIFSLLEAS